MKKVFFLQNVRRKTIDQWSFNWIMYVLHVILQVNKSER